jgi:23S rRNA pseudouridine1911/1915/1917 synthase
MPRPNSGTVTDGNVRPRRLEHGLVIVHEDRDLLVVDKPAGLLSVAAPGSRNKTCHGILFDYLRRKGQRPAVVHRLDRDTSGLLVFAKSGRVKSRFMDNWEAAVIERRYVCLAEGEMSCESGVIDMPLGEDRGGRVVAMKDGKPALTRWTLLKAGGGYSLLSLHLETGRRNQIRAHLHSIGHPVAGDAKYWAKTDPLERLCLHADKICFYHPEDEREMEFESPAPAGFERMCRGRVFVR